MKSERAVVGCILGVMVCLTGAMFYAGFRPDPQSLLQPVGPNKPMPPTPKAVASTPATFDGGDPWTERESSVAPVSPVAFRSSGTTLARPSAISVPSSVSWSNLAGSGGQNANALPEITSLGNEIHVSFNGGEGIVTLEMPSELTADADGDGELTAADLDAFTDKWEAMGPDADFNGDGVVDAFDMDAFVDAFASGESRRIAKVHNAGNFQIQLSNVVSNNASEIRGLVLQAVVATDEAK